jgi:hypothetical protein
MDVDGERQSLDMKKYPGICQNGLEKTMKNVRQVNAWPKFESGNPQI